MNSLLQLDLRNHIVIHHGCDTIDRDGCVFMSRSRFFLCRCFLGEVERAGYSAAIYGSKEWLLTQIQDRELKDRDIWLSEQEPIPEYPYQFKMWEYAVGEKIAGVSGVVNYTISFVDYTRR